MIPSAPSYFSALNRAAGTLDCSLRAAGSTLPRSRSSWSRRHWLPEPPEPDEAEREGRIAQRIEHRASDPKGAGSSPAVGTCRRGELGGEVARNGTAALCGSLTATLQP